MVQTHLPREMATSMERIHVQDVYDQIAPHFADLKQKAWPKVKQFIKSLEPGSLVADVGCGNGRYLRINSSVYKIGSDICQPLIQHANQQGHEVITANNLHLPYRDGIFDAVISIGVIHHFSSEAHRVQALKELSRVLSPGGKLMVYVWAFEQKHRRFESQDVLIPWHKPSHPAHRLYRGSCSDVDHSSNSSVSDDDTSSLSSLTQVQDSPPDEITGFPRRIQSFEDFRHSSEDVFEAEEGHALISSQNGCSVKQHTLVQECRRLEACLKELSEKQLSTNDVSQSKELRAVFPSPKYNFRKKSCAEVTATMLEATVCPSNHKDLGTKVANFRSMPAFLPCPNPPMHVKPHEENSSLARHQDNCIFSEARHSHAKPNIFQKLKMSFQGLIANHNEKCPSVEVSQQNKCFPQQNGPEEFPELFAVREFPMSSLPSSTEQSVQNESDLPLKNGVHSKMRRNKSDMTDCMVNQEEQKYNHVKLRSTSVKSLPLELSSVDPVPSHHHSRRRVRSIGSQDTDTSRTFPKNITAEERNCKRGHEQRKFKLNGLQKGQSRSQGDLLQVKTIRKNGRKCEGASPDLAKSSSLSVDDNDSEVMGVTSHCRSTVKKPVMDSASSDSFLSSISGVSAGGTPTNTDLCRYYHVFKEGELCDIVKQNIEDLHIIDTYFDHANWCLIAEKLKL